MRIEWIRSYRLGRMVGEWWANAENGASMHAGMSRLLTAHNTAGCRAVHQWQRRSRQRKGARRCGNCLTVAWSNGRDGAERNRKEEDRPVEIELKLLLDPGHAHLLRKSHLLHRNASTPMVQQLVSTYYDTADLWLRRHGATLRVRQIQGEGWVQTLKGNNTASAGLHRRDEWEAPLRGPTPEPGSLLRLVPPDEPLLRWLSRRGLEKRLVPLFSTKIERTSWTLRTTQGDLVEVALDEGSVRHETSRLPVSEIELELKEGEPVHLFDLALQLQEAIPEARIRIGNRSKSERGFSLYAPDQPAVVKAEPVELDASLRSGQALQAILLNCLRQVEANVDGVTDGDDPESVHQMRVGLRRLQSALILFRRLAPLPADLQKGFAGLRQALGAARDAEVLAGTTLPALVAHYEGAAPSVALQSLQRAASVAARDGRAKAARVVAAPRTTRLMLGFCGWVTGERWRDGVPADLLAKLDAPITGFAQKVLGRKRKRLLQSARGLHRLQGAQQHEVRIAAKKLRYASEFFSALCSPRRAKEFVRRLSVLQDDLGARNDARVADLLLAGLAHAGADPRVAEAAGFARGCLAAQTARGRGRLERRWTALKKAPLPHIREVG
jgi:triphosphatase